MGGVKQKKTDLLKYFHYLYSANTSTVRLSKWKRTPLAGYRSLTRQTLCSSTMNKPFTILISLFLLSVIVLMTGACHRNRNIRHELDRAEGLMNSAPDSALALLDSIPAADVRGRETAARYALLKSIALDKNYIDTTTFDVLQPAIDYYLTEGTPDEQLRTYYYQGRIYQNRGDFDSAMSSFMKGIDNSAECTDSLTLIRALVAQGLMYEEFYDFESATNITLKAARLSKKMPHKDYEFHCLLNAFGNAICLNNKQLADSIMSLCDSIDNLTAEQADLLLSRKLSYVIEFGSARDIDSMLVYKSKFLESDMNSMLNLASAYNILGDNTAAKNMLHHIDNQNIGYDTLKYQAILVGILKDTGNYKDALSTYEDFSRKTDALDYHKFRQKVQTINEKHQIELKAQEESESGRLLKWSSAFITVILLLTVFLLFFRNRSIRTGKDLALQQAKTAALENEMLAHRVEILEKESESLKKLLSTRKELPPEVRTAIKQRVEMLNSLLAGYITANPQYEKPYETWVKELTENTEKYMESNRLAFQASHPRFIRYFEEHGLTESEINYVCLYAIGLRGKEVGAYLKKRSHVNTSSAIRKKLGIDKHETNIGIYVRKLLQEL